MLCVSGLDPSGGAGLAADIEACAAQGGHALPIASVLTAQDSADVALRCTVSLPLLRRQLAVLLADVRPAAIKIGLLGSPAQARVLAELALSLKLPVVVDPVLRAGGGGNLTSAAMRRALVETLLPVSAVATPNAAEARALAGSDDLDTCARRLLRRGCANLLITGGDEPGEAAVVNRWYRADGTLRCYRWPRLPGAFHGAGCTLAAALATRLALGDKLPDALRRAQDYTRRTLATAYHCGHGRAIPRRIRQPLRR